MYSDSFYSPQRTFTVTMVPLAVYKDLSYTKEEIHYLYSTCSL